MKPKVIFPGAVRTNKNRSICSAASLVGRPKMPSRSSRTTQMVQPRLEPRRWCGMILSGLILFALASALNAQDLHPPDGASVFQRECAVCHSGAADSRAPNRDVLVQRSAEAILQALTSGPMRAQGSHLSGAERRAVSEYLSGKKLTGVVTGAARTFARRRVPSMDPRTSLRGRAGGLGSPTRGFSRPIKRASVRIRSRGSR